MSSPNQSFKTTMYMSGLFAVSELTSIKRENDNPLIFDATDEKKFKIKLQFLPDAQLIKMSIE